MLNSMKSCVALLLALAFPAATAAETHPHPNNGVPFEMISESAEEVNGIRTLVRTFRLDNGETIRLNHILLDDERLALNAEAQSREAMESMDRLCKQRGEEITRDSKVILAHNTIAIVPCSGKKPSKPDTNQSHPRDKTDASGSNTAVATSSQCSNVSVIIDMDGPGAIPQGDPAYFHIYAAFEYEGFSETASVTAALYPGCNYSARSSIHRWGFHQNGFQCINSGPRGTHLGSGEAEVCGVTDTDYISTTIY